MSWKPYDPSWLIELAKAQLPEESWLPTALSQCTSCFQESRAYLYFVDPSAANEPDSPWQFERNIQLFDKREGELVLDILQGQRIGGVEFLEHM